MIIFKSNSTGSIANYAITVEPSDPVTIFTFIHKSTNKFSFINYIVSSWIYTTTKISEQVNLRNAL